MAQGSTKGVPIDTDSTFAANSDQLVPSQKAVKSAFAAWFIDLTSRVTGVLPKANGGTNSATSKTLIASSYTSDGAANSGTGTIPLDNTTPQNTEGFQVLSLSHTPAKTTNTLKITANAVVANSVNATPVIIGLFQDSTANALKSNLLVPPFAQYIVGSLPIYHEMTAGTTSATTFKVRIGGSAASTTYFNSNSAGALFNGTMSSFILIEEYE
jgi:hypothetical protein